MKAKAQKDPLLEIDWASCKSRQKDKKPQSSQIAFAALVKTKAKKLESSQTPAANPGASYKVGDSVRVLAV